MRSIPFLTAAVTLSCVIALPSPASAQIITMYDDSGPRASMRVGYGGHGLDWETSIDSPLWAGRIRVRGGLGQGRWDSEFDDYRDPTVTRLAASALYFFAVPSEVKPYVGLGLSRYVPRRSDVRAQTGKRVIAGMEGSGERWTVGAEVEIDLPDFPGPSEVAGGQLYPVGRIGLAIRRKF
jgi:hypothetical protein